MARYCGLCKLALREDAQYEVMRIRLPQKAAWDKYLDRDVEDGQYNACPDCVSFQRETLSAQQGVSPATLMGKYVLT